MERENLPPLNRHNHKESEEQKETGTAKNLGRIIPFPSPPGRNLKKIRELYEDIFDPRS
ncbi:hypothetical protein AB3N61_00380 [Leptospira sp. WS58.C1]|jgi:hypothetical protein|uniref:hypothetical protein n=1 Tax=Leptospira TaxID=171 RepID=UPI0002BE26BC|nr:MULTISPECIES: hypothetical protein [unclassified Leptospira]EMJ99764.1 hypothetical protein LEP1GSC192_0681 [Leptospira sp. B5-022]MCR1792074.1 hypothetical protein [Leptospira sp. id769339]